MTLRSDSYGTVAEVRALTRHLLDGAATFSSQTRPTLADVEQFIDRWSAVLNTALVGLDVIVPVENEIVALACSHWVVRQAAAEVELTQRGAGYSELESSRLAGAGLESVEVIAARVVRALAQLDGSAAPVVSRGLIFTGTSVAVFARGQFDA